MLSSIRRIARPAAAHAKTAVRTMAGGHSHGPHISPLHTTLAKGFLVVTFLWIFYRAKQDGAVLLGLRHPWDGHHGGHGHGHGGPVKYEYSEVDQVPVLQEHEEEDEHEHEH